MFFIYTDEDADPLVGGASPVLKEALHDVRILEHDVVHVAERLAIQRHGRGLTLRADAAWPRQVVHATCNHHIYRFKNKEWRDIMCSAS